MEVIACNPLNPPDGYLYTDFTSPSCGGRCKCYISGGLQQSLTPIAILMSLMYGLGFPSALVSAEIES